MKLLFRVAMEKAPPISITTILLMFVTNIFVGGSLILNLICALPLFLRGILAIVIYYTALGVLIKAALVSMVRPNFPWQFMIDAVT